MAITIGGKNVKSITIGGKNVKSLNVGAKLLSFRDKALIPRMEEDTTSALTLNSFLYFTNTGGITLVLKNKKNNMAKLFKNTTINNGNYFAEFEISNDTTTKIEPLVLEYKQMTPTIWWLVSFKKKNTDIRVLEIDTGASVDISKGMYLGFYNNQGRKCVDSSSPLIVATDIRIPIPEIPIDVISWP